ncbi:MAG: hypothetical protein EXS16_12405 [Gemmataceae bacterium]|nr:hypothetical protein [Gemmataceae bacterium]
MIGQTKLSTIREELREAFAAEGVNPLIELDLKIRSLKKSKSTSIKELETLETFRAALAQIVEEPATPSRSKRARTTKKAV